VRQGKTGHVPSITWGILIDGGKGDDLSRRGLDPEVPLSPNMIDVVRKRGTYTCLSSPILQHVRPVELTSPNDTHLCAMYSQNEEFFMHQARYTIQGAASARP